MDALLQARRAGIRQEQHAWNVQLAFMKFLKSEWRHKD